MQYTVAVVFVYSIAVLGVFGLGLYNRRKHRRDHVDNETRAFLKNYEDVKRICEQKSRLGAIQALLHQLHNEPIANCTESSLNNLALLPISISNVNDVESDSQYPLLDGNGVFGDMSADVALTSDKGKSSPARAKMTLLGSSRRSYKECERCLARRGVVTTLDKCMCRFYDFETDDYSLFTETVDLSNVGSETNVQEPRIDSENCEHRFNDVSFM
ncbi:uncharacterized protein LOC132734786 isoform X2 [Ruditapes philippinarum]|nr:uncharacterized protein LOC132734786 isoform X2 [Ruditapes philippinarum]